MLRRVAIRGLRNTSPGFIGNRSLLSSFNSSITRRNLFHVNGNTGKEIVGKKTTFTGHQSIVKRSFFVRSYEVPPHLKDRVFGTWNKVFSVIFTANALVWAAWQTDFWENLLPDEYAPLVKDMERILDENFTLSEDNLDEGNLLSFFLFVICIHFYWILQEDIGL